MCGLQRSAVLSIPSVSESSNEMAATESFVSTRMGAVVESSGLPLSSESESSPSRSACGVFPIR